jgi:hypothetical protein
MVSLWKGSVRPLIKQLSRFGSRQAGNSSLTVKLPSCLRNLNKLDHHQLQECMDNVPSKPDLSFHIHSRDSFPCLCVPHYPTRNSLFLYIKAGSKTLSFVRKEILFLFICFRPMVSSASRTRFSCLL